MKSIVWVPLLVIALAGCTGQNRPLQLLGGAGPVYPAQAHAQGLEGMVEVRYDVAIDGSVENAVVVRAEPAEVFDEAALAAVRSWRFNAPLVDGKPQRAEGRISTVQFRLSGGEVYDER